MMSVVSCSCWIHCFFELSLHSRSCTFVFSQAKDSLAQHHAGPKKLPRPHLRNTSLDPFCNCFTLWRKPNSNTYFAKEACVEKYMWKCELNETRYTGHIKTPSWLNQTTKIPEIFIERKIEMNELFSQKS